MSRLNFLTPIDLEAVALDAYRRGDFAAGRAAEANVRAAYRALARQTPRRSWRAMCRSWRAEFTLRTVYAAEPPHWNLG